MVLASDFDKSKWLKAADLPKEKKFRIKAVTVEVIGTGIQKDRKLIVWFTNDEHGLVLNKTNNRTLRGAFGDNTDGWIGKVIVLFSTMTEMQGRMVSALRVRIPPPKQAAATGNGQTAPTPASQSEPVQQSAPVQQAAPASTQQQVDEFGQSSSPEKPSLSDDLNDEINF